MKGGVYRMLTTDIALCFVIDAVNDDNNALALFMLLI